MSRSPDVEALTHVRGPSGVRGLCGALKGRLIARDSACVLHGRLRAPCPKCLESVRGHTLHVENDDGIALCGVDHGQLLPAQQQMSEPDNLSDRWCVRCVILLRRQRNRAVEAAFPA